MAHLPFFSVLITHYNYGRLVGEAIDSVLAQDYPRERFEIIVADDGSTDDSRAVLERHSTVPGIRVVWQENRGQSAAFEAACGVARGDYVCLLDADDLFLPGKLRRLAAHIAALDRPVGRLFLCHDLLVRDDVGNTEEGSWFARVGVTASLARISEVDRGFPFSVPVGLVFSRSLFAEILGALPPWAFPRGTDGIVCPAALIRCGQVDYLHEALGVYRIHGANEFASLVDGVYTPRRDPRLRTPRSLAFLERYIDTLDLAREAREDALGYLKRIERLNRMPSAAVRLGLPRVAVAVFDTGDAAAMRRTQEALIAQTHGNLAVVLPVGAQALPLPSDAGIELVRFADDPNLPDGERFSRAWEATPAQFRMFLRAGDMPDPACVERHLFLHQHGVLVGVSVSDIRLADEQGRLLHADLYANSGAWKQPSQHIPPHATRLVDWVGAPMAACMFRTGGLIDAAVREAANAGSVVSSAGFWLAFQFQLHCLGALRSRTTLATCALPDGTAAGYGYVSSAQRLDGGLLESPSRDMGLWWQEFYLDREEDFRRWLPAAWHLRFESWLDAHTGAA